MFGEAEAAAGIQQDIGILHSLDLCGRRLWPIEVQADFCELFELWQQRGAGHKRWKVSGDDDNGACHGSWVSVRRCVWVKAGQADWRERHSTEVFGFPERTVFFRTYLR